METLSIILIVLSGLMVLTLIISLISNKDIVMSTIVKDNNIKAAICYYLPASNLKITAVAKVSLIYNPNSKTITEAKILTRKFTVAVEMVADTTAIFALNYVPNIFMSDMIRYSVNSKGLLETASIMAEDRTAQAIELLSYHTENDNRNETEQLVDPVANAKIVDITEEFIIPYKNLTQKELMLPWTVVVSDASIPDQFCTLDAGFTVSFEGIVSKDNSSINNDIAPVSGIVTRPLQNIGISFGYGEKRGQQSATAIIADTSKIIIVPVTRTHFAKRVDNISITDGLIKSNEITNPSSVEGFAAIPVKIAKSIISIPAQLIKFRYDNVVQLKTLETAKLEYEKAFKENEKYNLNKEAEAEKTKLEMMKSVLDAQKAVLDAQKAIEALTKKPGY